MSNCTVWTILYVSDSESFDVCSNALALLLLHLNTIFYYAIVILYYGIQKSSHVKERIQDKIQAVVNLNINQSMSNYYTECSFENNWMFSDVYDINVVL